MEWELRKETLEGQRGEGEGKYEEDVFWKNGKSRKQDTVIEATHEKALFKNDDYIEYNGLVHYSMVRDNNKCYSRVHKLIGHSKSHMKSLLTLEWILKIRSLGNALSLWTPHNDPTPTNNIICCVYFLCFVFVLQWITSRDAVLLTQRGF